MVEIIGHLIIKFQYHRYTARAEGEALGLSIAAAHMGQAGRQEGRGKGACAVGKLGCG